jgi:predicted dienelactone hydrolase
MKRRILKILIALALSGVLAAIALIGFLWLEHRTEVTLPAPTGPFAVGRALYDWVDDTTVDTLSPPPQSKRELLVWIWYPATPGQPGAVVDDYVPSVVRPPAARAAGVPIFRLMSRDVSKVHGHSLRNAEVSPEQRSYPVAIMRAGAASDVANYSTLAEDLASHGYFVVGFDAPYRTWQVVFPDGRVIGRIPENDLELVSGEELNLRAGKLLAAWTADLGFVLDRLSRLSPSDPAGRFAGRLDMTRVGVFGHSFGGATAAQFCSQDSRCKAGIDVDGSLHGSVMQAGIHKPFMFLLSGQGDFSTGAEVRQILADIQSVYDRLPADGRLRISIRGAGHFTFSDDGALRKSSVLRDVLRLTGNLRIDARRQLVITAWCVRSFFDAYLKGDGAARPKISSPVYPEIQVLE